MNKWRSATAEKIYRDHPQIQVRSAGTSRKAKRTVGVADIRWADVIVVMEHKHQERLVADFRQELRLKKVHILDVEDRYKFMDPRLIEELRELIDPILSDN